ncbi:heme peroxidase [Mycena vitilis]|nr:heme peroxidase [Mycena vitilis]
MPQATVAAIPASGGGGGGGVPGKGGGNPAGGDPVTGSGIPNVTDAQNPTCIPWYGIRDAIMGGIFEGRCGDNARAAVRLSFHDAANALPNGGADGSMLTDPNEVLRSENNGLQTIVGLLQPLPAQFGVAPGDIVHLACPGGPVIPAFVGRPAPRNIAPDGLLPNPESPVADLVARFADMGLTVREMMALIGAHTTGKQRFVDTSVANNTFDTTIRRPTTPQPTCLVCCRFQGVSHTRIDVLPLGTFKLDSDVAFSTDPSTSPDFTRFVGAQTIWTTDYAAAHAKMSLLGQDVTDLTDCSEILPVSIDLAPLAEVTTTGGGAGGGGGGGGGGTQKPVTDPLIDPVKLEAAIEQFRSIWLVPGST